MSRMRVRDAVVQELWAEADLGGDGQVSLDEFYVIWGKVRIAVTEA